MHPTSSERVGRSTGWVVLAIVAVLLAGGLALGSFAVRANSGRAGGEQNPATGLADFTETGVSSSATPLALPAVLSALPATPTRLAAAGTSYLLNPGTGGDEAAEWTFSERVGILANQELEISFSVEYSLGAVTHTTAFTAYLETQATAPRASVTFTIFWDAGTTTGVTLLSEAEIAQTCSGVGTCP